MHAEQRAAARAGPSLSLDCKETAEAFIPDRLQVSDRAGRIAGAVALIQMLDRIAGEEAAFEAKRNCFTCEKLAALFDPAVCAGNRLVRTFEAAARAAVPLPDIGAAEAAVDAARGDQGWIDRIFIHLTSHRPQD